MLVTPKYLDNIWLIRNTLPGSGEYVENIQITVPWINQDTFGPDIVTYCGKINSTT